MVTVSVHYEEAVDMLRDYICISLINEYASNDFKKVFQEALCDAFDKFIEEHKEEIPAWIHTSRHLAEYYMEKNNGVIDTYEII